MTRKSKSPAAVAQPDLPQGIQRSDLEYRKYRGPSTPLYVTEFEVWYTVRFGWMIPCLEIKRASQRARATGVDTDRYYAVSLSGELCCVGHGPHVISTHRVYVFSDSQERLQQFLTIKEAGAAKAGDCRDQRSTRAANTGARRRSTFGF